jgi:PHD/YefM family antitoxin component YafN of YafNO toxin-antitoxin module
MSGDCFQNVDVTRFRRALTELHELVGGGKGRVEVTRRGCADVCVLISKTELESLERALQIFAESVEFQRMSSQISEIVAATSGGTLPHDVTVER